jgi:hypothetical protein
MARFGGFSKYKAKKTVCGQAHQHDSKREAQHCDLLHQELEAGLISDLELQPQFWFVINGKQVKHSNGRRVGYQADFAYIRDGQECVDDAKGFTVRDWPLRKAIFLALFPHIQLREV